MKAYAPATQRNRQPILDAIAPILPRPPNEGDGNQGDGQARPPTGSVLEIASGTGEHAVFLSSSLPWMIWQPTDANDGALESIAAWRAELGEDNLRAPVRLDVTQAGWEASAPAAARPGGYDAIVCINMIHIAPWEACLGLLRGAAVLLAPGRVLYLYGPFRFGGRFTAPSNEAFDATLRARDPSWGVRDLDDVSAAAAERGFVQGEVIAMPANNHSVVFRRA